MVPSSKARKQTPERQRRRALQGPTGRDGPSESRQRCGVLAGVSCRPLAWRGAFRSFSRRVNPLGGKMLNLHSSSFWFLDSKFKYRWAENHPKITWWRITLWRWTSCGVTTTSHVRIILLFFACLFAHATETDDWRDEGINPVCPICPETFAIPPLDEAVDGWQICPIRASCFLHENMEVREFFLCCFTPQLSKLSKQKRNFPNLSCHVPNLRSLSHPGRQLSVGICLFFGPLLRPGFPAAPSAATLKSG